ncbi:MAG: chloride channel protein [Oscillatoriales cyanobacterium C42_A2020_001]|nr:chloride channel protein [Leptolyngbyaceae cyanobacterium C42_A2020_001]
MNVSPSSDVTLSNPAAAKASSALNPSLLNRLHPSPETIVLLLAVVIGGGTGLAVVLFHYLISHIHSLMLEDFMGIVSGWGAWTLACVPSLGGLVVGLMRWRSHDFGASLSSLIAAPQSTQKVSPIKAAAKAIAASVSLGTGASLGPEGPSVEIGSNIGVLLGQFLKVSQERQRLLLGAGAAAGLAAGFNAPIAGVFFALEVVLGTTFATSAVSVVLLSAVVAALISQIGLGGQPAFILPSYEVRSPLELPLYLGLGLFASFVSIAYTQAIQLAQRFFRGELAGFSGMAKVPVVLRPLIGGICVGMVALQFPQILGIGYETIEAMLQDAQFSIFLLLSLLVVKLAMTAISSGSGLVGGLFAPAMFLGATLGAAYGMVLPHLPVIAGMDVAAPPAYAMVGMAAVLAASVRAPLTAILLLFELTRDYRIILPLMAAVGLSVWLIERLKPTTYHIPTVQPTELKAEPNQDSEVLQHLTVMEAMQPEFVSMLGSLSVLDGGMILTRQQVRSALVLDDTNTLIGIVTLQDINRAIATLENSSVLPIKPAEDSLMPLTIADICTKTVLVTYQDEVLAEAKARMAARGLRQLPVVDRNDANLILGMLDQDQIALACSLAITQQAIQRQISVSKPIAEPILMPIMKQSA